LCKERTENFPISALSAFCFPTYSLQDKTAQVTQQMNYMRKSTCWLHRSPAIVLGFLQTAP